MTPQQQAYEDRFAALFLEKASECQNSSRDGVRTLWNPNKAWSHDNKSGRRAESKALTCRKAILSAIASGARTIIEIRAKCGGFGVRAIANGKDKLLNEGFIEKTGSKQKMTYRLTGKGGEND